MAEGAELAVIETTAEIVRSAPVDQVAAAQQDYQELCERLLDASDFQVIGDKRFKKKSAWRKLAVAFNVSDEILDEQIERDGPRRRTVYAKYRVRVTAPNGRFKDGVGVADIYEKCCDPQTCKLQEFWADSGRPTGHVHCGDTCSGTQHWSHPSHDIPGTAHTRATNRACSDLFGLGEVSAEEMEERRSEEPPPSRSTAPPLAEPPVELRNAMAELVKLIGLLPEESDRKRMRAELKNTFGDVGKMTLEQIQEACIMVADRVPSAEEPF